jgi:hypothetical protein
MAVIAWRLENISVTLELKTNERLNEVKLLLRITLKQQAESSASRRRAGLSWSS